METKSIDFYSESHFNPIDGWTWAQLEGLLKTGYDFRLCGNGNESTWPETGGIGDFFALIESFPIIVKSLMINNPEKMDGVVDQFAAMIGGDESKRRHVTMHDSLRYYIEARCANPKSQDAAQKWTNFQNVIAGSKIKEGQKEFIAQSVYNLLKELLGKKTSGDATGMILIRADDNLKSSETDEYGLIQKSGSKKIEIDRIPRFVLQYPKHGTADQKEDRVKRHIDFYLTTANLAYLRDTSTI